MVFSRVRLHAESQKTGNCFFMRQYRKWSMHDPALLPPEYWLDAGFAFFPIQKKI